MQAAWKVGDIPPMRKKKAVQKRVTWVADDVRVKKKVGAVSGGDWMGGEWGGRKHCSCRIIPAGDSRRIGLVVGESGCQQCVGGCRAA